MRGASPAGRNASGRWAKNHSLQMRSKDLRPRARRGAEIDGGIDASEQVIFLICSEVRIRPRFQD